MSREWKFERRDFEENQKRIEKEIQETWIVNINGTNGTVFKIIVLSLLGFYKIVIFWV
ncbi:hypothetical protein [Spiroplasma endosymbiont of Aleiodes alternator]|uniref:hypothetical protein n=1 Tax=Spiroplasma endosymbiont of Aleiodes alternator TaxID=3139329 RepID=UPI003CCB6C2A